MTDSLGNLQKKMEEAAAALDYEEARRLRDRMNLMRGGASADQAAAADTRNLDRQQPGAMGLGTSQQRVTPPEGWTPPPKPDPGTSNRGKRRR